MPQGELYNMITEWWYFRQGELYNTTEWQNMRKKTKYAPLHLCSDISDSILIQQGRSNELDVQNE